MQSVDISGLEKLDKALADMLEEFPEARREMHERIAEKVKQNVRGNISSSGLGGRIAGCQEGFVGSQGGYAAVRAISGLGPRGRADSPGAITNYLENGHRIRPLGKTKSRAKVPYVNGYHFYAKSQEQAQAIAITEAEQMLDEPAQRLEG